MTFAKKMTNVKTVFGKGRDIFLHIMGFRGAEIFFFYFWENMQPSHTQVLRFFPSYRQMFK